jgi:hypothetical protein
MMKAFVYRNTRATIPGWERLHEQQPRGYAYQTDTHFVHVYGTADSFWAISPGLTVSMGRQGALVDWVKEQFGAEQIEASILDVGEAIEGVWRPGIFFDINMLEGLAQSQAELRSTEQRLLLLVQRLDEVLLYIEPTAQSLAAFGQKTRELLILACTEVEAQWKYYLDKAGVVQTGQGFPTTDYVRLKDPLYLSEYEVSFPRHPSLTPIRPFAPWSAAAPTQSLQWYDQYNKTKHDGLNHLASATVLACMHALAANVVMFSARFGPHRLFGGQGTLFALVNSNLTVALHDCDVKTFYAPRVDVSARNQFITWGSANQLSPQPKPFRV